MTKNILKVTLCALVLHLFRGSAGVDLQQYLAKEENRIAVERNMYNTYLGSVPWENRKKYLGDGNSEEYFQRGFLPKDYGGMMDNLKAKSIELLSLEAYLDLMDNYAKWRKTGSMDSAKSALALAAFCTTASPHHPYMKSITRWSKEILEYLGKHEPASLFRSR